MVMRREVMPAPPLGCTITAPDTNDNFNLSNLALMGLLNKHIDDICSEDTIEQKKARAAEVSAMMGVAIGEVYSPWRVNEKCRNMGLKPEGAFFIKSEWDFDIYEHRRKAKDWIMDNDPDLVIGNPPCTYFSRLPEPCKYMFRDDPEWQRGLAQHLEGGKRHVRFFCELYQMQIDRGMFFLHEHPWAATSWDMPCMAQL